MPTPTDDVPLPPGDPDGTASRTLLGALGNGVLFVLAVDPETAFGDDAPVGPACFFAAGALIELPNGLGLSWRHGDDTPWFRPRPDQYLAQSHRLRLPDGVALREAVVEDDQGRETRWTETRFVSLSHAGVVMLRWELTPQNWSGAILVRSQLDLRSADRTPHPAWAHGGEPHDVQNLLPDDGLAARVTGPAGQALRVDVVLRTSGAPCVQAGRGLGRDVSYQQRRVDLTAGETVNIDVVMTVSDDLAVALPAPGFEQELERQRAAWQSLWQRVPLAVVGDAPTERAFRLAAFHLLQAVSPLSVGRDVGLPAWSAPEGIPGHEAWDEALALPFYSLHLPALARELLQHRARRLGPDVPRAWRSAAPMAAWRHHLATGDAALLGAVTGPMIVACARWWSAQHAGEGGLLAAWVLRCAARLSAHLPPAGWARLRTLSGIDSDEVAGWETLSRALPVPWVDGDVLALPSGDAIDTTTLMHLLGPRELGDLLDHMGQTPSAGWYARTACHHVAERSDGLSGIACAGALAPSDPAASWAHFTRVMHAPLVGGAGLDAGLSFGAMGGAWDVLLRHYLGLSPHPDGLHVAPSPPQALDGVALRLHVAGQWLQVLLEGPRLVLQLEAGGGPLTVFHEGAERVIAPGAAWSIDCR